MLGIGLGVTSVQQGIFDPIDTGGDVPEGATAHFSFAQGTYWTEADGDLTDAEIVSSTSSIQDGVGYTGEATDIQLIGPALDAMSTNMTIVLRGRAITTVPADAAASGFSLLAMADSADFNSGVEFGNQYFWDEVGQQVSYFNGQATVYDDTQSFLALEAVKVEDGSSPESRLDTAFTVTPTNVSLSTRGATAVTHAITIAFNIGYILMLRSDTVAASNIHYALESITVYPAQSDAALPALSTPL
jgi:hypothetical protein